jgi:hypothetical protein
MSDKILEVLGAKDEHEALRMVAEANQFLADVKEATGRETFALALGVIKTNATLATEVCKVTDKPNSEAIGVLLAWQASHLLVPELQKANSDLNEKVRAQDVAALVAQGKAEGKLTPAMAKHFEAKSADELRAFLAVAARVIPGDNKQPPKESSGGADPATNEQGRVTNADGQTYEQMKPSARSALKKSDAPLFNALHDDWVKAGKPLGVVAA